MLLVEMRDDLRVAVRKKRVALEAASDVAVVVQLAVLNRDNGPVLVRHRLMATRDVNDREAADAERDPVGDMRTPVARSTMDHEVCHCVQDRCCDHGPSRAGTKLYDTADSAHDRRLAAAALGRKRCIRRRRGIAARRRPHVKDPTEVV